MVMFADLVPDREARSDKIGTKLMAFEKVWELLLLEIDAKIENFTKRKIKLSCESSECTFEL